MQMLIIDPQEDFCNPHTGSLYVPGAEEDMSRLAALVSRLGSRLEAVHVTQDSHHQVQIFHSCWWQDAWGKPPPPFTLISAADAESGVWRAAHAPFQKRSLAYVRSLEEQGNYRLVIWPYHCIAGTSGHNIAAPLQKALAEWERAAWKPVHYQQKGGNPFTEHYSALRAEVFDVQDPSTGADARWLSQLQKADTLLVGGEALSHCVLSTVRDLATLAPEMVCRMVLLTDAASAIPGFEEECSYFLKQMTGLGMQICSVRDFL